MVLVVLPALAFAAIFLALLGRSEASPTPGVRSAFVGALVISGVALVVGLEVLSSARAIQPAPLAALWGVVTIAAFVLGGAVPGLRRGVQRLVAAGRSLGLVDKAFVVGLAVLFGIVFLTAIVSPPNNVDSINVHMVRVVRWAQNQNLVDTLTRPPFAEAAMLNLRVLFGDDRPVALIQWFSLLGSVVVISAVASLLGANRPGQIVAATFAASIPLAVLEASNTKNDVVTGLWVVCLAYYAVLSARRRLAMPEVAMVGAVLGLGLLTKGTFQPAAFPFLCWLAVNLLRKSGWRNGLAGLAVIGGLSVLLNLGYWARNVQASGTPYGSLAGLARALEIDELLPGLPVVPSTGSTPEPPSEPPPESPPPPVIDSPPPAASRVWPLLSRSASLLTLHTIFPEVGAPLRGLLARTGGLYDPGFLASLEEGLWNHEDSAGALIHVLLAITASVWAVVRSIRRREATLMVFLVAAWVGWGFLTLITNSIQLWGIRYQLGFLTLMAAVVGVCAGWMPRKMTFVLATLLLLAAIPYALLNNTRPWMGSPPRTRSVSIFLASQVDLLFTSTPEIEAQYVEAAERLEGSACRQVALDLGGRDLEYTLWWLLDAPQSGFRLEAVSQNQTRERLVPGFEPCAVLCTRCANRDRHLGLPLQFDGGFLRLYAAD